MSVASLLIRWNLVYIICNYEWHPIIFAISCWLKASHKPWSNWKGGDYTEVWTPKDRDHGVGVTFGSVHYSDLDTFENYFVEYSSGYVLYNFPQFGFIQCFLMTRFHHAQVKNRPPEYYYEMWTLHSAWCLMISVCPIIDIHFDHLN